MIGYLIFIFGKGVSKAKQIQTTDDFLVAGRNVGWWLLFATMGATVIGGGYSIGAVARTYELGLLWVLISVAGYLQFIFSGLVVAPKFREAKLYTVAGYFGHRFGERPRQVALILSLVFSVFIIAAQMAAFGSVLSTLMPSAAEGGFDLRWVILIGGAMVIIYSTAGGLLAVIYTDIYQFIVLFVGFAVTLFIGLPDIVSSWGHIQDMMPESFFSATGTKGWIFLITTFFAFLMGETFAPGYATRFCIGRDIAHTKKGIAGIGFFLALTFPVILFFIALYARVHHPGLEPQLALGVVVKQLHNPFFAGLIIAALLSAVMSSADSALNSCTAIFVKDIFQHQFGWQARGDKQLLRWARYCTIGVGVFATLIAFFWPDIIGLLLFTYHIWAPGIILPIVIGAMTKKHSPQLTKAIFLTMVISVISTMVYRTFTAADSFDPAVFGVLVSILVYFIIRFSYRDNQPATA